jgi:hypothetical protein
MSKEDVEAFKRGLEAGNRGDVDGLLDELHPDIEWHSALHALMGGEHVQVSDHLAHAVMASKDRLTRFTSRC